MQPRPIETAPRDGTEILVWAPPEQRPHWTGGARGWFLTYWDDVHGWEFGPLKPTHWAPLPMEPHPGGDGPP